MSDLGITNADRVPRPKNPHYIQTSNGRKISEWTPWVQFLGEVSKHTEWVRERNGKLTFAYEFDGTFPLGDRGAWFPFDFHELKVSITSNWDDTKLVFVPWADTSIDRVKWPPELAVAMLDHETTLVDSKCGRVRDEEVVLTLRNKFTWYSTPKITFYNSQGFSRFRYSEVTGSVLVDRRATFVQHVVYEFMRPLLLAVLAPLSILFFSDESARLSYNVSLLVAMSLAFMRSTGDRVTFSDYYKLAMFLYASIALVLSSFSNIIPDLDNINVQLGAWVIFLMFHALFLFAYLNYTWRSRSLHNKFHSSSETTYEVVYSKLIAHLEKEAAELGAISVDMEDSTAQSSNLK